jgi:hypothetical protein
MRGVIHVNEALQVAVVVDERTLRESRSVVPKHVNVTDTVLGPDIDFGPVSWSRLQELPFARLKDWDPADCCVDACGVSACKIRHFDSW